MLRPAAAAAATLALVTAGVPARAQGLSPDYLALVARYRTGDRDGSVAELGSWTEERVKQQIPVLRGRPVSISRLSLAVSDPELWAGFPAPTALMLHTDCALQARRDGRSPVLHESIAWSIAHALTRRGLASRWHQAMAEVAWGEGRIGDALDWTERGLQAMPDAPGLLLVSGALEEVQALQAAVADPGSTQDRLSDPNTRRLRAELLQTREVRSHLQRARDAFASVLRADPASAEAHLRLGRVSWKLGEQDRAGAALGEALARKGATGTSFLAHLFLGGLAEDAGRLDEAVAAYEAALALDPRAQSARIALSHARLRQGDPLAARAAVELALRAADDGQPREDPFWLYTWGLATPVEERLASLRKEASE
jgi:tetratricopeptide (TPR) repeat protein